MDRRRFLGGLIGAASAMVLDPEKALWVPGRKTISIPATGAPPRTIIGLRLDSGTPVFSDQLLSGICLPQSAGWEGMTFLKVGLQGDPDDVWIQILGRAQVTFADYSPSLAS